jgi:hypothetical protein
MEKRIELEKRGRNPADVSILVLNGGVVARRIVHVLTCRPKVGPLGCGGRFAARARRPCNIFSAAAIKATLLCAVTRISTCFLVSH